MEAKTLWHVTMSLDGYIAGPDDSMEWAFAYEEVNPVAEDVMHTTGAILAGRHWFDVAQRKYQGRQGIYGGKWQGPVFVLTHHLPVVSPDPGITFLSTELDSAVKTARAAAADKNLEIFGASVAQQCLQAGLIDEIVVHLAPVLLGNGTRFYGEEHPTIKLERLYTGSSNQLTSMRFRVMK